jgi:hypothetical protein
MKKPFDSIDILSSNNFKIEVFGKLDKQLSEDIFGGLSISYKSINNNTISRLEGKIIDQAGLIGILNTLFNMRYPIINVEIQEKD